jgi:hypothetical protein
MHLLSDDEVAVRQRDAEIRSAQAESNVYKQKVALLLDELLKR